jgi:uncharacterized protein involved in type VI secretion and phage assembly
MHGSKRLIDALSYAPGNIVCRVELIPPFIHDIDKTVARGRKVLRMADATNVLHEFACRCAEDALSLVDNPDERSVAVIKAKRDWVAGKISRNSFDAAARAARAAARDAPYAARDAACAAAYDAAYIAYAAANKKNETKAKQNRRLASMISALLK